MNKKTLDRDIIFLLVSTLITLVSWVGLEVYHAYRQPTVPVVEDLLSPIQPTLETKVLDILENRKP